MDEKDSIILVSNNQMMCPECTRKNEKNRDS